MLSKVPNTELPELPTFDPAELISLAELASEGLGWSIQATTPRAAIGALAERLGSEVITDDIGRRCVTRETARRLLAERDELEQRQRAARQARRGSRPRRRPNGVPGVDGAPALSVMKQHDLEAEQARKDRMKDEQYAGQMVYRSYRDQDAS